MELEKNNNFSDKAAEDYDLVQLAIKGDQKAYSVLMDRYRNSIYHMMYKMVHKQEDAEDLTLEAFGKAFNKLKSYTPKYAFSTWLFKIASNNAIDYIRKKRLKMLSIDESMDDEGDKSFSSNIKSNSLDPEEKYIHDQRVKLMRSVMSELNHKYRLMIELRYFEDLSYEEIADELEIPLGTVKAQLYRAKDILYNLLQTPDAIALLDDLQKAGNKKMKKKKK